MEKSKRSLTVRMKHEDDYGVNEDSNLSHSVRATSKEDSQRTTTLTDNKRRETTKTKDLQCMKTHALASTTLTCSPSGFRSLLHIVGFRSVLCVVNSIVVAVPTYSIFDMYENGSFEVLSLHLPSVAADRRQL